MAKFTSKYKNLRIVIEPDDVEFVKGKTRIVPGKHIQFENNVFTTDDKKEIEFLKNHSDFGRTIFCEDDVIEKAEKIAEKGKEKEAEKPKEEK